jgi:hypothetical protein
MKVKLSQVYNFGGKEFEELNINIEEMTGKDFMQCEKEFKARNKDAGAVKELEDSWAVTVAAKALGVKYGDLLNLVSVDYLNVVNGVKRFLSKGWDEKEAQKNITEETTEEIGA